MWLVLLSPGTEQGWGNVVMVAAGASVAAAIRPSPAAPHPLLGALGEVGGQVLHANKPRIHVGRVCLAGWMGWGAVVRQRVAGGAGARIMG